MRTTVSGAIGAIAMAFALAAPAQAGRSTPQYTSLTVFGDSLVDAGNIFTLTGGRSPAASAGYFNGRWTNGYDWTDHLSLQLFGTPTEASLRGGTNFAYGGAQAGTKSGVPDLVEQLAEYDARRLSGLAVDPNGLYVLNFGGNDVFRAPDDATAAEAWLRESAATYANGIQQLNNAGVRNLLITGYPVRGDPLSLDAEGYLTEELAKLNLAADTTLFRFSYLDFFARVGTDPSSLGLPAQRTDITCRAAGAAAIAGGCEGIFSFDGTHPSAPVQYALYRDIERQFDLVAGDVPEPATWGMMIVGVGAVGGGLRRRRSAVRVRYA